MHNSLKSQGYNWRQSGGLGGGVIKHDYQNKAGEKKHITERANGEHSLS